MARKKSESIRGVFKREYDTGAVSYGIDYIHPITGQRIRKILKDVSSEEEALKVREIELTDARRGAINKAYGLREKARAVAFVDMVDKYLEWSRQNKKSWQTDEHNAKPLKRSFKSKLATDINPFVVERYKMARLKEVSRGTINNELSLGSQVFKKAVQWKEWAGENPFEGTKFKRTRGKKPGSLSIEDVRAIIKEIPHYMKKDMVEYAFNTGWRISEIRRLKWEDVDLEEQTAWISDPKNARPIEVELNDAALAVIRKQKKRGPYVFCHLDGSPFRTNLTACFKEAAKRAGINLPKRKAWHILRRTWASMFLQNGGDVETLRQLGNWKDHAMPMWYADAAGREHKKSVLNRIPKLEENSDGTEMALNEKVANLTDRKDR